jgi:hypothetical protein
MIGGNTTMTSYYFHRSNWSIDTTPPGRPVSVFTALVLSVTLGLGFVVFMPVVGFIMLGKGLLDVGSDALTAIASLVRKTS